MTDFIRRYGAVMTAYMAIGCIVWMVGMIMGPMLIMLDQSIWYEDLNKRGTINRQIEDMYKDMAKIDSGVRRLDGEQAEADESRSAEIDVERAVLVSEKAAIEEQIPALEIEMRTTTRTYAWGLPNYVKLFSNDLHRTIFFKTIWASAFITLIALIVCYPLAYYLAKVAPSERAALLMLGLVVPYWINEILRTFAWLMILSWNGIANQSLQAIGIIAEPINFLDGNSGVMIGMIYAYVLFMVFPMYNTIDTLDRNQVEAARDLGASTWRIHWRIVIPHAKPGIAVGCIMTFMLTAGSYAVPQILGGPNSLWFTQLIYNQFFDGRNWNLGSAYAFSLLLVCILFIVVMMRVFRINLSQLAR